MQQNEGLFWSINATKYDLLSKNKVSKLSTICLLNGLE